MIDTLAQLSMAQWFWGVLWTGLGLLTVALVVLMQTRWGQSQPLRKCIVLSVWAHVLLAAYATTVQICTPAPGDTDSVSIRVATLEGALEPEDRLPTPPAPQPWEQAAQPVAEVASWTMPDPLPSRPWPDPSLAAETPLDPLLDSSPTPLDEPAPRAETTPLADLLDAMPQRQPTAPEPIAAPVAQRVEVADAAPTPDFPTLPTPDRVAAPAPPPMPHELPTDTMSEALFGPPSPPPQLTDAVRSPEAQPALAGIDDLPGRAASPLAPDQVIVEPALVPVLPAMPPPQSAASLVPVLPTPPAALAASPNAPRPPETSAGPQTGPTLPPAYQARLAADRIDAVNRHGGSQKTEAAVQAALVWLAANQAADGRWDPRVHGGGRELRVLGHDRGGAGAQADTGMTGLALLAFLGAGHTHQRGPYADNLQRGLDFLLRMQAADGNLGGRAEPFAAMYCHGMATLALSEAYGMTRDAQLLPALRRAVDYTLAAQHPSNGGWRYRPGDLGDTSQLGWQWMVLTSAELAGLDVPLRARDGVDRYLKSVSAGFHHGLASYRMGEGVSRTMTAEALVCRQLLGLAPTEPAAIEAGDYLLGELPGSGRANLYYWYYGTMAMFQLQGRHWQRWNEAMTDTLVSSQRADGPQAGSWDPVDVWGGYGGRVYSTALGALCLEVYYRYLPLYSVANDNANRWR